MTKQYRICCKNGIPSLSHGPVIRLPYRRARIDGRPNCLFFPDKPYVQDVI